LPTRLMAGLALLKHMYDLSDEALCDRWIDDRLVDARQLELGRGRGGSISLVQPALVATDEQAPIAESCPAPHSGDRNYLGRGMGVGLAICLVIGLPASSRGGALDRASNGSSSTLLAPGRYCAPLPEQPGRLLRPSWWLRPLIQHPGSLSDRQSDPRPVLDGALEYRAGPFRGCCRHRAGCRSSSRLA
jgi:hypothetical protein